MDLLPLAVILLLHSVSVCDSQVLKLKSLEAVTDCAVGLRANQDSLILSGVVNATLIDFPKWGYTVGFLIMDGNFFVSDCYINIGSCSQEKTEGCYCLTIATRIYKVVLNITAAESISNSSVYLVWPSLNRQAFIYSNVWNLPQIFEEKDGRCNEKSEFGSSGHSGYRNAAIFLACTIALGLIVATVHRLDASLLFSSAAPSAPKARMDSGDTIQKV